MQDGMPHLVTHVKILDMSTDGEKTQVLTGPQGFSCFDNHPIPVVTRLANCCLPIALISS